MVKWAPTLCLPWARAAATAVIRFDPPILTFRPVSRLSELIFHLRGNFYFFFVEFKNSVINGIKISENENVLKVNKMEMNEIIGTKKKMFDGDEWSSRGNCSIERAICRLMMLGAASSCVGALGRRASVGHFVAFRSGRRLTDRLPSS